VNVAVTVELINVLNSCLTCKCDLMSYFLLNVIVRVASLVNAAVTNVIYVIVTVVLLRYVIVLDVLLMNKDAIIVELNITQHQAIYGSYKDKLLISNSYSTRRSILVYVFHCCNTNLGFCNYYFI
jgi:hypothetical protein